MQEKCPKCDGIKLSQAAIILNQTTGKQIDNMMILGAILGSIVLFIVAVITSYFFIDTMRSPVNPLLAEKGITPIYWFAVFFVVLIGGLRTVAWLRGIHKIRIVYYKCQDCENIWKHILSDIDDYKSKQIEALADGDANVRESAVSVLGFIGNSDVASDIIPLLEDKKWPVRKEAIKALGMIGGSEAIDSIIIALGSNDSTNIVTAMDVLKKISRREKVEGYMRALGNENHLVRLAAASELGKLRVPEAHDKLTELKEDENEKVRKTAIKALNKIKK